MDDKKIDELINKALQEDLALPEGLSERLERQIDFLAQEENISPSLTKTFLLLDKRNRRRYSWRPYSSSSRRQIVRLPLWPIPLPILKRQLS